MGEEVQTFTWTTDDPLEFLETREVSLPYNDPAYTIGDDEDLLNFVVSVSLADDIDQESSNGTGYSQFRGLLLTLIMTWTIIDYHLG